MTLYPPLWIALITPFQKNGDIDIDSFSAFLQWQREQSSAGFLVCGSSGEAPLLSSEENAFLLQHVKEMTQGDRPLMAGATATTLAETLAICHQAEKYAYDILLTAPPSYVKPTQKALLQRFTQIHDNTSTPIVIYNHPSRTGVPLADETICQLAQLPRIIGLKDAGADLARPLRLRPHLPAEFLLYTGNDMDLPLHLAAGGQGAISVTANLVSGAMEEMIHAYARGQMDTFTTRRDQLDPLCQALFLQGNPVTPKYALHLWGHCRPDVRDPLTAFEPGGDDETRLRMALAPFAHTTEKKVLHG